MTDRRVVRVTASFWDKSGMLFKAMKVIGAETQDGSVELVGIELDLSMDWE